jgi:hypothetical protein
MLVPTLEEQGGLRRMVSPSYLCSQSRRLTMLKGNNLVWTTPVTEESTEGISFAPPITPVTYSNDTPVPSSSLSPTPSNATFVWPSTDDTSATTPTPLLTCDSTTASAATSASTASSVDGTNSLPILSMIPDPSNPAFIRKWKAKAQSHAKKHEPGHIPRPPNAFMLFRSAFVACNAITNKTERNSATLSQIIGHTWKGMTVSERKEWYAKANVVFDKHMIKFPEYNFRPDHPPKGTKKPKRKMKEVEVKDAERCAQVAQAVLEGKSGEELEKIMEEWDRTHSKKTNIRFDPLLTAETFEKQQAEKEKEKQKQKEEPQFLVEHPEEFKKKRTATKKKAASSKPTPTLSIPDSPASLESPVSPFDGYPSQVRFYLILLSDIVLALYFRAPPSNPVLPLLRSHSSGARMLLPYPPLSILKVPVHPSRSIPLISILFLTTLVTIRWGRITGICLRASTHKIHARAATSMIKDSQSLYLLLRCRSTST